MSSRLIIIIICIVLVYFYNVREGFVTDPCAGLTDHSLASSISNACLQKMFIESGCSVMEHPPNDFANVLYLFYDKYDENHPDWHSLIPYVVLYKTPIERPIIFPIVE
jgi:hypothetical protein